MQRLYKTGTIEKYCSKLVNACKGRGTLRDAILYPLPVIKN
jgi:hypothetical protein